MRRGTRSINLRMQKNGERYSHIDEQSVHIHHPHDLENDKRTKTLKNIKIVIESTSERGISNKTVAINQKKARITSQKVNP